MVWLWCQCQEHVHKVVANGTLVALIILQLSIYHITICQYVADVLRSDSYFSGVAYQVYEGRHVHIRVIKYLVVLFAG